MTTTPRLASLQLLRALAAWTVVFHHYVQIFMDPKTATGLAAALWQYGALGVDVFFVLSGFVMCLVVQNSTKGAVAFLIDRVFRIAPAYWFLSAVVVAGIFLLPQGFAATDYTSSTLLKSALFIPSYNPANSGLYPVLTVGWTLNFEMFFYTALAFCMALSRKWFLVIFLALFSLIPLIYPSSAPLSELVLSPRLHEFSVGTVLGLVWTRGLDRRAAANVMLSLVAACCFVLLGWLWMLDHKSPTIFALSVVVFALVLERHLSSDSKMVRGLVHLGDLSYSTYLVHCIVMWTILDFTGKDLPLPLRALSIVLTIAGTYVFARWSYQRLENGQSVKWAKDVVTRALTESRPILADDESLSEAKKS